MANAPVYALIVEDDHLILWSLKEIFSQEGYTVETVSRMKDALELARTKRFRLILADPETGEDNSLDMLRQVRGHQPAAVLVVLSAMSRNQIEPLAGSLGAFEVIDKPFGADKIKAAAKRGLRGEA